MEHIKIQKIDAYVNIDKKERKFSLDLKIWGNKIEDGDLKNIVNIVKSKEEKNYPNLDSYGNKICFNILSTCKNIGKVLIEIKEKNLLGKLKYRYKRKRNYAHIGIGTNMGDRNKNIDRALHMICEIPGVKICKKSEIIETKAWGLEDQDDFLNCVVIIETILKPKELLLSLQKIEKDMKRVRKIKWGPRIIDLDILLIEDKLIYEKDLIVPHPYLHQRAFVMESMAEISPHLIHPVLNKSMEEIYKSIKQE